LGALGPAKSSNPMPKGGIKMVTNPSAGENHYFRKVIYFAGTIVSTLSMDPALPSPSHALQRNCSDLRVSNGKKVVGR